MTKDSSAQPAAPLLDDPIVTFWDIAKRQYSKNRPAMIALWLLIITVMMATAAPFISMNAPYVMKSKDGLTFPLFDQIFNRLIFKSGVDVFFNVLLFLAPVWWLGARTLRASALNGRRAPSGLLRNGIPFGAALAALALLAFVAKPIYAWLLLIAVAGLALLATRTRMERGRQRREVLSMRVRTRFQMAALFVLAFILTLSAWKYTAPVVIYRPLITEVEQAGGWAISPPVFEHPDSKGEDGKIISDRFLKAPFEVDSSTNILGTDNNGRDVFSRILYGTRISLTIGIIAVSIYATIGTILGCLAGYYGGRVDMVILYFVQVMICIPGMFLILTIVAVFEDRNIFLIMLAISLVSWTGITRLVRGEFMRQRNVDYVVAARALGIPQHRIIFGHILKNSMSPVLVASAFGVASAILSESFLSFIGLGDLNAPTWGQLLQEGRMHDKNWLIFAPGMAIFFVVTVLNVVGEGLRDALDPKLRQ